MNKYQIRRIERFAVEYKDEHATVQVGVEGLAAHGEIAIIQSYFEIIEGIPPEKEVVWERVRGELLKTYKKVEYW